MAIEEKAPVILERVVRTTELIGDRFSAASLSDSLKQAIEHSKGGGLVAPMWLLARGAPNTGCTANSEDHSGPGEFKGRKGHYVVTLHGGVDGNGVLTPEILATAIKMHRSGRGGLTKAYAADLLLLFKKDVFADLLHDGMPDGNTIPVYSFEQVTEGEHQHHLSDFTRFAIVRTLEQARRTIGYESIDRRVAELEDLQVIAYTGGVAEGEIFRQSMIRKFKRPGLGLGLSLGRHFRSNRFDPEKQQGRVLSLNITEFRTGDSISLSGISSLDSPGHYVGVTPEARAAIQAASKKELNSRIAAAVEKGEAFYSPKGQLYAVVNAPNSR